ncbi:MAG: hypothetical protein IJS09_00040 [Treponema sp.]|nr:hypothetical protein [Treponema sp.]
MKKHVVMAASLLLVASSLFAYNPPAGGQNLLRLSSPFSLSGANSTAGGSVYEVIPSSVVTNPALSAFEQRIALDLGFTFMSDKNKEIEYDVMGVKGSSGSDTGAAFQVGATFPTRWCVPTFMVQGVFAPLGDMTLGNNILFTANVSKDITDKVSVGLGVTGGGYWYSVKDAVISVDESSSDWMLAANTGVFYNHGDLLFFKQVRFAATLMNLGKLYTKTKYKGIKGLEPNPVTGMEPVKVSMWPGIATPRGGVAFVILDTGSFKIGGSTDIAVPGFMDLAFDLGVGLEYSGLKFATFRFASAWELDVRELAEGSKNLIPSATLSVKFNMNTGANAAMAKRGWAQSELTAGAGWRNLYSDINAFSFGAVMKFGMEDKEPPVITLWDEEH